MFLPKTKLILSFLDNGHLACVDSKDQSAVPVTSREILRPAALAPNQDESPKRFTVTVLPAVATFTLSAVTRRMENGLHLRIWHGHRHDGIPKELALEITWDGDDIVVLSLANTFHRQREGCVLDLTDSDSDVRALYADLYLEALAAAAHFQLIAQRAAAGPTPA